MVAFEETALFIRIRCGIECFGEPGDLLVVKVMDSLRIQPRACFPDDRFKAYWGPHGLKFGEEAIQLALSNLGLRPLLSILLLDELHSQLALILPFLLN